MTVKKQNNNDAREMSRTLELAIAQIEMSLQESDYSIGELILSMTTVTTCIGSIQKRLSATANSATTEDAIDSVCDDCNKAEQYMQKAVVAFQFYDRLSQRISHIQENLKAVATLMQKPEQQHPKLWDQLQEKMRSVYSIEQEQIMYNTLLQSLTDDSLLTISPDDHEPKLPVSGTVELF